MKKRYYSFSTAILTAATIFSLMGSHNVLADNIDSNQITTYSEATPSHITSIWTKGVTPPTNFIEGTDGSHAPYIANQGWYDITKTFNGKDDLLCGAATAGNMLHWWFDQNKDQIEGYLTEYPEKQAIIFNGEQMFDVKEAINTKDRQLDSKLFEYFKEKAFPTLSARRRGVSPDHVIDMFINGYRMSLDNYDKTPIKEGNKDLRGGIFDQVFTRGDQSKFLTNRYYLRSKTINQISQLIKQELIAGKALAISHTYNNIGINHVINLWGADFNSEGNLEAIYVTDSDSNASIGMKKYYVGVNSAGEVAVSSKKIDNEHLGAAALGLYTLSAGQDIWHQTN